QAGASARTELDEKVDVALGPEVVAEDRAEEGKALHAVAAAEVGDLVLRDVDAVEEHDADIVIASVPGGGRHQSGFSHWARSATRTSRSRERAVPSPPLVAQDAR